MVSKGRSRLCIWLAIAVPQLAPTREVSAAVPSSRPNIVFILADDLGYGDLSCYGQRNFRTPNVDQMASEGMRFTQHYAGSTVCAASRACLLSGLHTGHVYQRINGEIQFREDPLDICVAQLLKNAGYATAMIGKSGLSSEPLNDPQPGNKGFDHFFGYTSHIAAHRYYPETLWLDGKQIPYPDNHGMEGAHYSGDLFLADALAYLDAHVNGPFFLHLSLQQPHADLCVPTAWKEPFVGKFEEVPFEGDHYQPSAGNHYRAEPQPKATFAGMVTYLDDTVGQVLNELRKLDIADRTVVFFASDNGAMSEGGWNRDYFNSSGPLRGGKRDLYEGGIRVPMIAWWPKTIQPGKTTDQVSAFWDFVPTACELAGIDPPANTDGISYLPTLLGHTDQQKTHEYLYWEFYEQGGIQAVRQGNWKAVRLDIQSQPQRPLELYNLSEDIGETRDVSADHPDEVTRMKEFMRSAHNDAERFQITPPP